MDGEGWFVAEVAGSCESILKFSPDRPRQLELGFELRRSGL